MTGWRLTLAQSGLAAVGQLVSAKGAGAIRRRATEFLRYGDATGHPDMKGAPRIDPVLSAILRHHGVRSTSMLLLSRMRAVPELAHGVGGTDVSLMPFDNDGEVARGIGWLGRGWRWEALDPERAGIAIRRHDLPHALLASLEGRALRDVLSHPALDPMDLVVGAVETRGPWPLLRLSGMDAER